MLVPIMRHCAAAVSSPVAATLSSSKSTSGNPAYTPATLAASASPESGPPVVGSSYVPPSVSAATTWAGSWLFQASK